MKTEAYLGLDLGGTGVKAGVFSRHGKMLAFGRKQFEPTVSREGHVDIPVETIREAARSAVREVAGKSGAEILAMAVSSQGETFVTLDAKDRPLHDAIMWYDSRAGKQAAELRRAVQAATGRPSSIDAIVTVSKIKWLKENRPGPMRRARRHLLLPDYVSYILTGRAATDINTAGSTGMMAPGGRAYDPAVLKAGGIDEHQLADVLPPGTPVAKIRLQAAKAWGLSPGTLLVAGTNDQYAGALGAGNCRPGILSETSGTCLALVTLAVKPPRALPEGLMSGSFPVPGHWFILAYSKTAGLVLDWFRNEFYRSAPWKDMEAAAKAVPAGSNGLLALPHFDGTISPVGNPSARGAFCNLTLRHKKADMFRALLESLAFSLRENMEIIARSGYDPQVVRSIGGGAQNSLWLQIKADVTGREIEKPAVSEAAVFGAAMLAAAGRGEFKTAAEASEKFYRTRRIFAPDRRNARRYRAAFEGYLRLKEQLYNEPRARQE